MILSFKNTPKKIRKILEAEFDRAWEIVAEGLRERDDYAHVFTKTLFIEWNPRMRSRAGYAHCGENKIGLNARLLSNHEAELLPTFTHELAHIFTHILYPKARASHGWQWRHVMRLLVAKPEQCHKMPVKHLQHKRRKFLALCKCSNPNHSVGAKVRNKILKGRTYRCKSCRATIELKHEITERKIENE